MRGRASWKEEVTSPPQLAHDGVVVQPRLLDVGLIRESDAGKEFLLHALQLSGQVCQGVACGRPLALWHRFIVAKEIDETSKDPLSLIYISVFEKSLKRLFRISERVSLFRCLARRSWGDIHKRPLHLRALPGHPPRHRRTSGPPHE